jgi:hypothetical protein
MPAGPDPDLGSRIPDPAHVSLSGRAPRRRPRHFARRETRQHLVAGGQVEIVEATMIAAFFTSSSMTRS